MSLLNSLITSLTLPQPAQPLHLSLTRSPSGWRKVFPYAFTPERTVTLTQKADAVLSAQVALSYARFLKKKVPKPRVVIARDSRPTGEIISSICTAILHLEGCSLRCVGVGPIPEIASYARNYDAFLYISASHNPIEYNGFKFGLNDGGVLSPTQAQQLSEDFVAQCLQPASFQKIREHCATLNASILEPLLYNKTHKQESLHSYDLFIREVIANSPKETEHRAFFHRFTQQRAAYSEQGTPLSILIDFNGSARAASIDRRLLESLGVALFSIAETPGDIRHRIVPEGSSLTACAQALTEAATRGSSPEERSIAFGFVPDCDGDRGNIVYYDQTLNRAVIPHEQAVFALSVVSEICELSRNLRMQPHRAPPIALVTNGPTSLRVEAIAQLLDVHVFRTEVGEAHLIEKAHLLRKEGYCVRILGEGSNGGSILHPAAVRDPLHTVFALLKLLLLRGDGKQPGLFAWWCAHSHQTERAQHAFTISDLFASLPAYTTTPTHDTRALLQIRTTDHALLKSAYQRVFERRWAQEKDTLKKRFGICSYRPILYRGREQQDAAGDFSRSAD